MRSTSVTIGREAIGITRKRQRRVLLITPPTLGFLSAVAVAKTDGLHLHLLSRAWFESQALRRFGLAQWGGSSS